MRHGQAEDGDEAGGALLCGDIFELLEEEIVIGLVVGVVTGEAGAVDAGGALEGIYGESGVVSESAAAGGLGCFDGFF